MRIIENRPINTTVWFWTVTSLDGISGSLIQTSLSGVSDQRRRLKFRLSLQYIPSKRKTIVSTLLLSLHFGNCKQTCTIIGEYLKTLIVGISKQRKIYNS